MSEGGIRRAFNLALRECLTLCCCILSINPTSFNSDSCRVKYSRSDLLRLLSWLLCKSDQTGDGALRGECLKGAGDEMWSGVQFAFKHACVFMSHHFFVRTEPLPEPGRSHRVNLRLTTARRHSWPPGNKDSYTNMRTETSSEDTFILTVSVCVLPSCLSLWECGPWSPPPNWPGKECDRTTPGERKKKVMQHQHLQLQETAWKYWKMSH